jgi:hypothetical protein
MPINFSHTQIFEHSERGRMGVAKARFREHLPLDNEWAIIRPFARACARLSLLCLVGRCPLERMNPHDEIADELGH